MVVEICFYMVYCIRKIISCILYEIELPQSKWTGNKSPQS